MSYSKLWRAGAVDGYTNVCNIPLSTSLRGRMITLGLIVPKAEVKDSGSLRLDHAAEIAHMQSTPEGDEWERENGNGVPNMVRELKRIKRPSALVKRLLQDVVIDRTGGRDG